MYISTKEMIISIICNACGVLALIIWAIEVHKPNANQRFQGVENVKPTQNEFSDIVVIPIDRHGIPIAEQTERGESDD